MRLRYSLLQMMIRSLLEQLQVLHLEAQSKWVTSQKFRVGCAMGKGAGLAGLLDRQFQLRNPWILTCQDRGSAVARCEQLSWWFSFWDFIYTAFKMRNVLVMCSYQEKGYCFLKKTWVTVCVWAFSIKMLLQRHVLKAGPSDITWKPSYFIKKLKASRQS